MKNLIENFPEQIYEAIEIGKNSKLTTWNHPINNIVISGLGGSGIGGTMTSQIVENIARVPITVNKSYFIPSFVNNNTLFIACSYSGNTEETLNCLNQAIKKNAKIVCITTGGRVAEIAKALNLDIILIPAGMPPRTCFGYSLIQQFYILSFFGIIPKSFEENFKSAAELLVKEKNNIQTEAKLIAENILGKTPVIYSANNFESVSIRFRQQLNENSKILCWHHAFPELNHNELVGWTDKNTDLCVVLLRNDSDYERTKRRMDFSKNVFSKYTPNIIEIFSKGNNVIENTLYLINLTDYVSIYLAELRGVDAVEVNIIDSLKAELSKA